MLQDELGAATIHRASSDALCKLALQALAADPQEEGLQEVLSNVFGFPSFRGHQLPVVQAVLQGRSTLAIMPTGARDSLHLLLLQLHGSRYPGCSSHSPGISCIPAGLSLLAAWAHALYFNQRTR